MSINQPRFFSENRIESDEITLDGEEAQHLLHVLRIRVGETLSLFDDSGREFLATLTLRGKKTAELKILQSEAIDRELPVPLTVGVSLPKGDRQKLLVEKLVELGVSELVPLIAERGVAQPTEAAVQRLGKQVIAASKQCGRNRLMRIGEPQPLISWLSSPRAGQRWFADPDARHRLADFDVSPEEATIAIGPEGGFSPREQGIAAEQGWQGLSLGPRILRVETAAWVASTLLIAALTRN